MKQSTILQKGTNLVAAGLMFFFSIPKLLGEEEVIEGFKQLESLVPIDLDIFRVFTGIVEFSIAILLVVYTIKTKNSIGKIAYFLLFATMAGALTMEFFARPEPMIMMVVIAIMLFMLSIYKLKGIMAK